MPHAMTEVFGVRGDQLSGACIERNEARRIGMQTEGMLVIHPVRGGAVENVAIHEHRARRHVERP